MSRIFSLLLMTGCCWSTAFAGEDIVVNDFEAPTFGDWVTEGDAFGSGPVHEPVEGQMPVTGVLGHGVANSFVHGDAATGVLTSQEFKIERDHLAFLIGGGNLPNELGIELLANGQRVRFETGSESEGLQWQSWDVRDLRDRNVRVRIFDKATGGWGHILVDQIVQTDVSRRVIKVGRLSEYRKSTDYYHERFRPQFHFTPEMNWMNDPNGLVYFDGEYHLFYQHNPYANDWGHMSWGHAISMDLLHWKHLPIALHDEYDLMAFSGSAVVDENNTSGFGMNGKPPLVAIYTGHGSGLQTQDLAWSNDRGRTWTKYEGNPVIDIGESDFRDPKVFWHPPTKRWVMVVSLAVQKKLRFYGSPDLKQWTLLSEFGPAGVEDKPNWECPDLFELPIENEPGKSHWVLEADMGNGSVAGGSGGEYFTGVFDGTTFTPDSTKSLWVDFGRDFYAPVSWSNIPASDGRRIWLGWMNNWETCLNPTAPWRSAMSIPRELTLRRVNGQLKMCQRPVRELDELRTDPVTRKNIQLADAVEQLPISGQQLDIRLTIKPGKTGSAGVRVLSKGSQHTEIGFDADRNEVYIDRTHSGIVDFHPKFSGRHAAPLDQPYAGEVRLRILVDSCSVEVFVNDGEIAITDLVFPDPDSDQVEVFAAGGSATFETVDAAQLKSVWHP